MTYFDPGNRESFERTHGYITAVERAIHQLEDGCLLLSTLHGSRAFRASTLQLLASGFEQIMKVIVLVGYEHHGLTHPNLKGKVGHDLEKLLGLVLALSDHAGFSADGRVAADIKHLRTDERFHKILRMLSAYGIHARYWSLDQMTRAGRPVEEDPERQFQEIKDDILGEDPRYEPAMSALIQGNAPDWSWMYPAMTEELLRCVQRGVRGLCRMFSHDLLGQAGKTMLATVGPFVRLDDEQLHELVAWARVDDLAARP